MLSYIPIFLHPRCVAYQITCIYASCYMLTVQRKLIKGKKGQPIRDALLSPQGWDRKHESKRVATSRNQASKTGPTRQVPGFAYVHASPPCNTALSRYPLAAGNLRRRPYDVPIVSIRANPNSAMGHLARLLLAPPKVPPRALTFGAGWRQE